MALSAVGVFSGLAGSAGWGGRAGTAEFGLGGGGDLGRRPGAGRGDFLGGSGRQPAGRGGEVPSIFVVQGRVVSPLEAFSHAPRRPPLQPV